MMKVCRGLKDDYKPMMNASRGQIVVKRKSKPANILLIMVLSMIMLSGVLWTTYLLGMREGYKHFEVRKCWVETGSRAVVCYQDTE